MRRWKPFVVGGLVVLTLVALIGLTPSIWLRIDGWIQNQRDRVWSQLETALGQKAVYQRIAPNVLAALEFQDVRLLADDGSTVFHAASVRLSWDWGLLFQGRFTEALRRIQIINATLDLDAARDRKLLEHWAGFFKPSTSGGGTAFGFQIEGFNLNARWTDGQQSLQLDRGFAVLSPQGGEWGLKFRGSLAWQEKGVRPNSARATLRGELRADPAFQNLSLRTEASSVQSTWADLEPITLQVTVDPERVSVAKVADPRPLDVQVEWDRRTNLWRLRGAAEGFRPSRLVHLKLGAPWKGLAEGTLSGEFDYQSDRGFFVKGEAKWPVGSLPAPLSSEPLQVRGQVELLGETLELTEVRVQTPRLEAWFNGNLVGKSFLPEGTLVLDRWVVGDLGTAQGTVTMDRNGSLVSFSGQDWRWNSLGTASPSGWVEKTTSGWNFSLQGPVDGTLDGSFSATGAFDPEEPRVDASVELIAIPLAVLRTEALDRLPGFDLPADVWALETTVRGHLEWGARSGPAVSVTSFAFHDPLIPDRTGTGTASWRGRHLELALNPSSWDSVRAGGTLIADVEDGGAVGWSLVGALWSHPFDLKGRWVPSDRTLAFSGSPGVSAVVHQDEQGVWTAEVQLEPLEMIPGWTVGFQGGARLAGEQWSVLAEKITVAGRYPWNQEAFSLRTRAQIDPDFFRLDGIVLNDAHGVWGGSSVSNWSVDFSTPWTGRLALATPETGRESLTVDWVGTQLDAWKLNLRASGLDVTRAGLPGLESLAGRLTASGTLDWSGSDGTWNLQTSLSEARWGDSPLGYRANLSGTSSRLTVRGLNLSVNPIRIVDGSIDLDADARTWKVGWGFGLRLGTSDWESRWAASGQWSPPEAGLAVTGALAVGANTWAQKTFPDWGLQGRWTSESWGASLDNGGLTLRGSSDGTFEAQARAPFPVSGDASGTWSDTTFQVGVQGFRADLALVKEFVNSPIFSLVSGVAEGNFTLGGRLADPEVNGRLLLRDLRATSSFVRLTIGPLDVPVVFEGHRVRIDPVDMGPGPQTWMISGAARLDHLLPEEYQFAIQTDALSVIPVSYQYTGLSVLGGVTGQFVVQGNPFAVTLGGRLILQDAVVTLKPTEAKSSSGSSLGFNVDLAVITGRKVEFLWPNESLPLLRAVTATGQTVVIKANDVASTWSVNGRLGLRTGEINYLSRTFVVREGQLLLQEDQTRFDPRITVRAEWRLREASGPTIVSLRADGALSAFSPRFDASPYKSAEELQQLVGTTLALPTDYTKPTNFDTALSLATDVGTSFLLTPFEETVKKNFQLDLFTVKTEILKKSLLGRGNDGNTPLEASDYLDNTRLFFGKYIGDDLFLQGTLAFRRDGSVATQVSPRMVIEPELQMEFQTPFFLLNWTLLPQHPETLFVTDNTVTFRWNWSY